MVTRARGTANILPAKVNIGGVDPTGSAALWIHIGTDQNYYFGGAIALGTGVGVQIVNDATNTAVPLEISASIIQLSAAYVKIPGVAVAALVAAATAGAGARAFVTDANATTFNSTVAGGGANNLPVFSDGTNWKIG